MLDRYADGVQKDLLQRGAPSWICRFFRKARKASACTTISPGYLHQYTYIQSKLGPYAPH